MGGNDLNRRLPARRNSIFAISRDVIIVDVVDVIIVVVFIVVFFVIVVIVVIIIISPSLSRPSCVNSL